MAFVATDLALMAYGNGISIWTYVSDDLDTAIDNADYFLNAYAQLNVGDWILCNSDRDGTPKYGIMVVATSASGGVTTTVKVAF